MDIQITIIGFLLAWIFTEFPLFTYLVDKIPSIGYLTTLKSALKCHKCMSLYFTLFYGFIFFNNFFLFESICASFFAATYNRIINSLPINL